MAGPHLVISDHVEAAPGAADRHVEEVGLLPRLNTHDSVARASALHGDLAVAAEHAQSVIGSPRRSPVERARQEVAPSCSPKTPAPRAYPIPRLAAQTG